MVTLRCSCWLSPVDNISGIRREDTECKIYVCCELPYTWPAGLKQVVTDFEKKSEEKEKTKLKNQPTKMEAVVLNSAGRKRKQTFMQIILCLSVYTLPQDSQSMPAQYPSEEQTDNAVGKRRRRRSN